MRRRAVAAAAAVLLSGVTATACARSTATEQPSSRPALAGASSLPLPTFRSGSTGAIRRAGATKIDHLVIITMENHSFDNYFGTYPGAAGFRVTGRPCVPRQGGHCIRPFHTTSDISPGGPHGYRSFGPDVNHGRMNGFVKQAQATYARQCTSVDAPACVRTTPRRVMSFYDQREIPNYWRYARRFVLADHFFEATNNWSLPQHLYMVSGWAAKCANHLPSSCHSARNFPVPQQKVQRLIIAWTDITYLLHAYGISWRYYVETGQQPDCTVSNDVTCPPLSQSAGKASIWNPLPQFDTVQEDQQLDDVQQLGNYYTDARNGTLPAVSWVTPNQIDSEHAPARVSDGQAFVTKLVNAAMRGPQWRHTAIVVTWDDWGGLYDGVRPPRVDAFGDGIRVPTLIISPWARRGYVDHHDMSTDDLLGFIEDRWLRGQRLNPATDGRPDPRPDVRERHTKVSAFLAAFDFHGRPQGRLVLRQRPPTDLTEPAGYPPPTAPCTGPCRTP